MLSLSSKAFAAKLALVAMLALALLPSASRAWMALQGQGNLVSLCTAAGMRWVSVDGDSQPTQEPMGEPCAFCKLQTHGAPPPAAPALMFAILPFTPQPPLFLKAPRTLAVWLPALSRGPPLRA